MIELLQGIVDFISIFINFFVSLISGLINMFKYIALALGTIAEITVFLPADLLAIAMAFISVSVVYLIIGR